MSELIRVGVLRGGIGHEYEVSLKTGASVLQHLAVDKYQPVDILISRDGSWHLAGLPTSPTRAVKAVDVVFNALHGEFGEDGQAQQLLDYLTIPYTGSGAVASALGMNKLRAKEIFKQVGIKTPFGLVLKKTPETLVADIAYDAFQKISPPWIIKPVGGGSSVALFLARTYPELEQAISACFQVTDQILVEEYIRGREATSGVLDSFRGRDYYPLLPIEIIIPVHKKLFDYEAKYTGITTELCPGRFSSTEKKELEDLAVKIHQVLGLRHYSRSDFIISPRGIYALEVNTLPGLTTESLIPKSLKAAGISYDYFLDHIINLALSRR